MTTELIQSNISKVVGITICIALDHVFTSNLQLRCQLARLKRLSSGNHLLKNKGVSCKKNYTDFCYERSQQIKQKHGRGMRDQQYTPE